MLPIQVPVFVFGIRGLWRSEWDLTPRNNTCSSPTYTRLAPVCRFALHLPVRPMRWPLTVSATASTRSSDTSTRRSQTASRLRRLLRHDHLGLPCHRPNHARHSRPAARPAGLVRALLSGPARHGGRLHYQVHRCFASFGQGGGGEEGEVDSNVAYEHRCVQELRLSRLVEWMGG